jgi:hypothetical protein
MWWFKDQIQYFTLPHRYQMELIGSEWNLVSTGGKNKEKCGKIRKNQEKSRKIKKNEDK